MPVHGNGSRQEPHVWASEPSCPVFERLVVQSHKRKVSLSNFLAAMEPPPLVLRRDSYSESERHAIRQQLERMLAGPPFKNSKRYPILLRYVVEHTLEGHTADLKERTMGV